MRVFWSDTVSGRFVNSTSAIAADLSEATRIWFEEVRGAEGSFLGLIDGAGRVVQFRFEHGVPDDEDDAHFLKIILVDFPCPSRQGSYAAIITCGEVIEWMQRAFEIGNDPASYQDLVFEQW
jgi:hypothetical protein